ncbi:MAG: glycoside hydrolase family 5 protein [Lachnospiraceae bacterium]|nr:glycoside hydrolase family 5 protein [Lachnospiraceae bacterium]
MKSFPGYNKGVNLGGWLSQCNHTKERYNTFICKKDIEIIKGWGLDHVRLPIDYNLIEDAEGNYKEDGFSYIQKAIDWCEEYSLNLVLDVHKTFGYSFDSGEAEEGFFDSKAYQERFYKMWEELAKRYGKYSDRVAFELLNEVTAKEYSDAWNRISTECIKRIRNYAPDVKILLGGYYNNSIEALKDLPAPLDSNIVYNFHCYEPLIFTHQGAGWIATMNRDFRMPLEVSYKEYNKNIRANLGAFASISIPEGKKESDIIDVAFFEELFAEAVRVAEERNVALYCGEFGVIDKAEPEDTLKWYKMITSCFNKYKIGRAMWSYKEMDFGISDKRLDGIRKELL